MSGKFPIEILSSLRLFQGIVSSYEDNKDGTFMCTIGDDKVLCIGIKNTYNLITSNSPTQIPMMSSDNKIFVRYNNTMSGLNLKMILYYVIYLITKKVSFYDEINFYKISYLNCWIENQSIMKNITDENAQKIYAIYLYTSNPDKYCLQDNYCDKNLIGNNKYWTNYKNLFLSMYELMNTNTNVLTNFCVNIDVTGSTINNNLKFLDCASNPTLDPNITIASDDSVENFYNKYGLQIGIGCGIFIFIIIIICIVVIVSSGSSATKLMRRRKR